MPSVKLDSTQPWSIITPADATVQAGEVVFSLVDIRKGTFGPNDADLLGLRAIRFDLVTF